MIHKTLFFTPKSLILLLLLGIATLARAQPNDPLPNTKQAEPPKWDIGFNLIGVIDLFNRDDEAKYEFTSLTTDYKISEHYADIMQRQQIVLRRMVAQKSKETWYLRSNIGGIYHNFDFPESSEFSAEPFQSNMTFPNDSVVLSFFTPYYGTYTKTTWGFQAGIGVDYMRYYNKSFWGLGATLQYGHVKHTEYNVVLKTSPYDLTDEYVVERWRQPGLAINAMFGYCITDRLALRIEPTFTMAQSEHLWVAAGYSRNLAGLQASSPGQARLERRTTARFQPIKFLNLSYSF
jgi:hypothetical protein